MPQDKDCNCEYVFINIEELPFVISVAPLNWGVKQELLAYPFTNKFNSYDAFP